ncbi:MAG: DRTGG domain-containing protein [Candidatus Hodarchaeales archaeon]
MVNKIVITSIHKHAGKTSLIVGMAKASDKKKVGYFKPLGDRLVYREKRLWDHDAATVVNILGLKDKPEDLTIGFEHSKLKLQLESEEVTREKILETVAELEYDRDVLLIESGRDLMYGTSVHLDALSVTKTVDAKLLIVVDGIENSIVDDITFIKKYIDITGVNACVLVNKVHDPENFKETHNEEIKKMGIEVAGIIPYKKELTHTTAEFLREILSAKVVAGEGGLGNVVKNVLVGAASASAALRNPIFAAESKLVITSGDRSDMILAALETDTSAVILSLNTLPPPNIISKATDKNVPLLLVPQDTFQVAKRVDDTMPLLMASDKERMNLLERLVREHVNLDKLFS